MHILWSPKFCAVQANTKNGHSQGINVVRTYLAEEAVGNMIKTFMIICAKQQRICYGTLETRYCRRKLPILVCAY